jgi:4a-hydroxytetrahydrobiopterin dehydratase
MDRMRPYAPAWLVKPRRGLPALHRTFSFNSFAESMWFTLKVGELAERDGQRPIILISWDRVTVALATPGTDGLHRSDFVAAAAIDRLYELRRGSSRTRSRASDA